MANGLKTSLIMAACVVLAVLPNAQGMYSNWDLGQPLHPWRFGADAETGCFGKSGEGFHRFG